MLVAGVLTDWGAFITAIGAFVLGALAWWQQRKEHSSKQNLEESRVSLDESKLSLEESKQAFELQASAMKIQSEVMDRLIKENERLRERDGELHDKVNQVVGKLGEVTIAHRQCTEALEVRDETILEHTNKIRILEARVSELGG